jgi:hypothetical protein
MATGKLKKTTAIEAFKKVKPIIDSSRKTHQQMLFAVGKEYRGLSLAERKKFRVKVQNEYGWSKNYINKIEATTKKAPKKLEVIRAVSGAEIKTSDNSEVGLRHLEVIAATPEVTLKKAAKAGMFDEGVTVKELKTLQTTGKVPAKKPEKKKAKTDLQKVRAHMKLATKEIDNAVNHMSDILMIMEDSNITDAKGREATALISSFEKLCTKFAAANPITSARAFKILRGEA